MLYTRAREEGGGRDGGWGSANLSGKPSHFVVVIIAVNLALEKRTEHVESTPFHKQRIKGMERTYLMYVMRPNMMINRIPPTIAAMNIRRTLEELSSTSMTW